MCATRYSTPAIADSRKRRSLENAFFNQETQFAVVDVASNVRNEPPTITNLVPLSISEDQGKEGNQHIFFILYLFYVTVLFLT